MVHKFPIFVQLSIFPIFLTKFYVHIVIIYYGCSKTAWNSKAQTCRGDTATATELQKRVDKRKSTRLHYWNTSIRSWLNSGHVWLLTF